MPELNLMQAAIAMRLEVEILAYATERTVGTFVLDVAGYHGNVTGDHRPLFVPDAEIHLALEHPNNLLVRMLMSSRMGACFHFPPDDHSLLASENTAFDFIGDTLPRQFRKCAEARYNRHPASAHMAPRRSLAASRSQILMAISVFNR
jgi:hypothetical protein